MARVGRWSYELATGRLHRSETLDELYRSIGVDPNSVDARAPEREQVALLCQALRFGEGPRKHHVQVPLPGAGALSCRAEVECAHDGTPLRIVGLVRDLSSEQVAQRRLGQSGQRFTDLMDMVPGGVALLDPTGRVVDANPGLCDLLDLPLERLRGIPAATLCADSDSPYPDALGLIDSGPTTLPEWLREVPPGVPARLPGGRRGRCGAATAPRSGASWPCPPPASTTAAGAGWWSAPTSPSGAGRPSCCAAPAAWTS